MFLLSHRFTGNLAVHSYLLVGSPTYCFDDSFTASCTIVSFLPWNMLNLGFVLSGQSQFLWENALDYDDEAVSSGTDIECFSNL